MNRYTLKLLKLYLDLPVKDKVDFIRELAKLEKMNRAVRQEYITTLQSLYPENTE